MTGRPSYEAEKWYQKGREDALDEVSIKLLEHPSINIIEYETIRNIIIKIKELK